MLFGDFEPQKCQKTHLNQRAPNPPEFAQPRLSRVKRRSSPAKGYKFGCVCSYMAGHEDVGVVTGHTGTNTPKFVPPRWGRPQFDPTQTGLCKFGWVWSSLIKKHSLGHSEASAQKHSKGTESTPWGTFRPGPLGTPVHGGRDRDKMPSRLEFCQASGQKGSAMEGVGEKLNRVFSGFFPWQVREWYVPGPS